MKKCTITATDNMRIYKLKIPLTLRIKHFFKYRKLYKHQRKALKKFYKGNLGIPYKAKGKK